MPFPSSSQPIDFFMERAEGEVTMSQQVYELSNRRDLYNKYGCLSFTLIVVVTLFSLLFLQGTGEGSGLFLVGSWGIFGAIGLVCIVIAINANEKIDSITHHLHYPKCTQQGEVKITEQKTVRQVMGSSSWGGTSGINVIVFEKTQCSECGSVTVWQPDQPRYLEQ